MHSATAPSIIVAPDARPYFGVDTAVEELTESDITTMHIGFLALCRVVSSKSQNNGLSRMLMTQTELSDYIDPAYAEGFVEVDVFQSDDKNDPSAGQHIYLTHRVMQTDEEGEEYLGWKRQSIFELDEEGGLIRTDRMPPSIEEDQLVDLADEQIDRQFLTREFDGSTMFTPPPIVDNLSIEEARKALRAWVVKNKIEIAQAGAKTDAMAAELAWRKQAEQESKALLKTLGMNEQRVRLAEFAQLVGLVKRAYNIPEDIFRVG